MRLINADKLYPDTFGKGRLAISQSQIADAPTVQAVPIEVLQEIRQEINDEFLRCDANAWSDIAKGLLSARCIIDRKIKELSE